MTNKVLNWGLLSTARINRVLIPLLKSSQRNQVTTVASRSLESAREYAREWRLPRFHGSYEALLEDPEIDVIYNSLPNSLHAEWTIRALRAGKHVLCEKPLALSVQEVDDIAAAARETGRVATEGFMYRHHAQTLRVQDLVASGMLGTLQLIRGGFTYILRKEHNIRLNQQMGGGSLWDVGCYPISYARMLTGAEPLEVFGWQASSETGVDLTFVGQMRFAGGVLAQFDCGFQSPARSFMEIVGSEGSLHVPSPFKPGPSETIEIKRGNSVEKIRIKGAELYGGEVEDLADAVLKGAAPRVSLSYSRGNCAAIVALLESASKGKPVRL